MAKRKELQLEYMETAFQHAERALRTMRDGDANDALQDVLTALNRLINVISIYPDRIHDKGFYRLELLFDPDKLLMTLQGNQKGLTHLLATIAALASSEARPGDGHEFDEWSGLSHNDLDLIIQRVRDDPSEDK